MLSQDPKNHWLVTRMSFDHEKILFWNASIWVQWPCRLKSWVTVIGFGVSLRMGKMIKNTFWDYPTFAWSCIITASKIRTSSLCFSIRTTSMFLFEKKLKYNLCKSNQESHKFKSNHIKYKVVIAFKIRSSSLCFSIRTIISMFLFEKKYN